MGDKLYSRRKIGAWPWIEFTAVELARRLGGKVYDPQSGSLYEELTAEHDQRSLRALHEEDLKTWQPTLVSHYWASLPLEADDRRRLEHIVKQCCACAEKVLKINQEPSLRSEQVDWWHTFNASPELKISASTSRDETRSVHIGGAQASPLVHRFADAVAARLGLMFRRVDEFE